MKRVTLNSETLAMMIVDYEGGMTLKQVSDKYNMAARTARRFLEEGGCTIRQGTWEDCRRKFKCDCGHANPTGSKFCNMCGKSLKTEEEKIIDGLLDARATVLQLTPDGLKKDADAQIMRAVKLLKEKCGVQ